MFNNVTTENQLADINSFSLRISVDTKAKVKIGDFSRHGKTRASEAPQGLDHDYAADATLVPLGILNLKSDCKEFRLPRKKWRN
ncbi:MAG: hypothetical protein Q8R24_06295, partial [Legionellaceae bacterium]|nr:hypothetical protein [Legionellaceae bacterium]